MGFNFITIETKTRNIDKNNLDLVFEIKKGDITKISKISFTGDKKIRDKRLRDIIASEENKFWKFISRNTRFNKSLVDLDIRLLNNYYKSIGYYDVEVTSSSAELLKGGNIELIYSIDSGKRYKITKITTNADSVFDKKLFFPLQKKYKKIIGDYYSPFKIKKLLDNIDEIIDQNNIQFVEHNVKETINGDSIEIVFNVFEGEKVLVERINIIGNSVTNESVIRSELVIDEGDPFTKLGLDKSISNIKSRRIFKTVDAKLKNGTSSDLKVIDITVEEQPTGELSAGAGIGTSGGSFSFNVKENNWLGEGKNVGLNFDISATSLKGTLSYTDPNYDLMGNSLNYFVSSTANDKPDQGYENTLTAAGINTSFEQYKNLNAQLGLEVSIDSLTTDGSASKSLKKQEGTFNELAGTYGFSYDRRNRSFMPTDGYILGFEQNVPLYADKKYLESTILASKYKSMSENVIGASKFYISAIKGLDDDDVRLSKRKFVRGSRLRGFKSGKVGPKDGTDHVGGKYTAALNFGANLPTLLPESTKTDINLFLDFGNVWGVDYDNNIDDSNKIRSSTGAAASWASPLGPMTFILSTNLAKASTDQTEGFNFNLGTTF